MGVVTVSSSASQSPFTSFTVRRSPELRLRRAASSLHLKSNGSRCYAFLEPQDPPLDSSKEPKKRLKSAKNPSRVNAVAVAVAVEAAVDLDYNEAAAALENIYRLDPAEVSESALDRAARREGSEGEGEVVRNRRRGRRLSLDRRVAMKKRKKEGAVSGGRKEGDEDEKKLVREYPPSANFGSLDWKRIKIPPVLTSIEHASLFKQMQPMKAIFEMKDGLLKSLDRDPTDCELAVAVNMSVLQMRRHIEDGGAARNKLIKHNLRLVLFVMNKYFHDISSGQKFQDICQAGAKGLITAIDRFEPKRGFRLSTYALFWIRHSIVRSMTQSSLIRVSFGIESVRLDIQKAKLGLMFELGRLPTKEEIIERTGISAERYYDVMKASKTIGSLNAKHAVTQEEFINGVTDIDGVGGGKRRQPPLLRLALDDVLDSLKPKESMVIRQRFGLDGKGNRTLGEIAGNLSISREMVRKYELKALMKLKHPTRVDYLRRYI